MPENGFNGWAIVECMGHRRLAGKVTETTVAGQGMLRVDVPAVAATTYSPAVPEFTQFVAPSSLYALTPCTEEVARAAAAASRSSPVTALNLQLALPAPAGDRGVDDDDDVGQADHVGTSDYVNNRDDDRPF
jgi:hypothetical protein